MNQLTIVAFKQAYADELSGSDYTQINPNFASKEYCHQVVEKMFGSFQKDNSRHDYLKYNDAMRRAAKRFGIKTTKQFREILKSN